MDKLFGTNGVRGIFGKDFNLEFINDLVISIANHFENGKILVANSKQGVGTRPAR